VKLASHHHIIFGSFDWWLEWKHFHPDTPREIQYFHTSSLFYLFPSQGFSGSNQKNSEINNFNQSEYIIPLLGIESQAFIFDFFQFFPSLNIDI